MKFSWLQRTEAVTLCVLLFAGMLIVFFVGHWLRKSSRFTKADSNISSGPLVAAIFAMFGLILAFAFGISANRYENVRTILVQESNAVSTAILLSDLYSDSVRTRFRRDFKNYLDASIMLYENPGNNRSVMKARQKSAEATKNLWQRASEQSKLPGMLIPSSRMLPSLNAMFDIGTERDVLLRTPIPDSIIYLLFVLSLATSFIAGITFMALKLGDWVVIICFTLFATLVVYIILDLGRPLRGLINASTGTQAIVDLRQMFDEP